MSFFAKTGDGLDGNPWLVLADVCRVSGLTNPRMVAARLDGDEKDAVGIADAIGREQLTTVISEGGFFKVTQSSRKPVFTAFWRWATHIAEVYRTASR